MGQVILIASGKGGTGKTTVTANLGFLLGKRGYRTAVLDMDMGMRNLDLYLGLENRVVYNMMDVFTGICRIRRALIKDKRYENLYLMSSCPGRNKQDITPLHMEVLCRKLKKEFDYILIDCPAGMGDILDVVMTAADKAVLITEADIAAVRDADILSRYLLENGFDEVGFVVNKIRLDLMKKEFILSFNEINEMIKGKMLGIIQYDDNIYISTNKGIPIAMQEGSYIEKNLSQILDRILE